VLATVKDNVPRTTPVDFFNDGFTIWIAGEPGLKIRNIRSNPRVAVGIYHPMDHSKLNQSLQIQGRAKLINLRYHRKEFMMRVKKFGILSTLEKIGGERVHAGHLSKAGKKEWVEKTLSRFNLIRIDPDEITFLYIHPTSGMEKDVWEKSARL
jgi:nitroimidazol reductase NimA-like FMN-containing flavoprotein (pyridoxamine 5'-phosphate oxidase superfamily)